MGGVSNSKLRTTDKRKSEGVNTLKPSPEPLVVSPPPSPPDGPAIQDMIKKYGNESCACVGDWVKKHGFPSQGSFSLYQLQKLEQVETA